MEDDLNILKMEDDLNFLNWKTPLILSKGKTAQPKLILGLAQLSKIFSDKTMTSSPLMFLINPVLVSKLQDCYASYLQ